MSDRQALTILAGLFLLFAGSLGMTIWAMAELAARVVK